MTPVEVISSSIKIVLFSLFFALFVDSLIVAIVVAVSRVGADSFGFLCLDVSFNWFVFSQKFSLKSAKLVLT